MTETKKYIEFNNVTFSYGTPGDETESRKRKDAVKDVSFAIEKGTFVCIIGSNGSGKSTVAKLMNGLILPTSGTVISAGYDTSDDQNIWEIRRLVGMVFQNPDNQIIATSVEEDVAFGLENIGVPREEMIARVDEALKMCGVEKYRHSEPHLLSGGQKQRVSIAGILAMRPSCIVLDESTAMLDPKGRKQVLDIVKKLNKEENITVILITHHMDEIVDADKVLVMEKGELVKAGTPVEIFSDRELISDLGLDLPPAARVFEPEDGLDFEETVLTKEQGVSVLMKKLV